MSPRELTVEELAEALVERLQKRQYKREGKVYRTVYQLDLRGERWGNLGFVVLRNPKAPGWPDAGDTAEREGTAERWIFSDYAAWVQQQLQGVNVGLSVQSVAREYLKKLDKELGPDHSTTSQRRSYIKGHVIPGLGNERLATLRETKVQAWLDGLTVTKSKHGETKEMPASAATVDACRATLSAIWQHAFGSRPKPWAGVVISRKRVDAARRRQMVDAGRAKELIKKGVYTPSEFFTLLAAARWADLNPEAGLLAPWACRNLAPSMVLQLAFASRISELVRVRWHDIDLDKRLVLIAGTKTESSLRILPLQDGARPWLNVLRATQNGVRGEHFLLRTHPDRDEPPIKDIYARRMSKVQVLAGLKIDGKRSHIFRATHSSWANMSSIRREEIKLLLGHSNVFGGATDRYIEWLEENAKPEFWTYLRIPSPEAIDAFLASGWTPPGAKQK